MTFASVLFLYYFLPGFLLLYYLVPVSRRNLALTIASYVFYGWWRPDFLALLVISTCVDYSCGRAIVSDRREGRRTGRWVAVSAVVNLGLLAYFKYANFGVDTLNALLANWGFESVSWTAIVLPIGISFYTFQTLSYTVDLHRGAAPPVKSILDFACYVAMFPQLVAGPIVRYHSIADQLRRRRHDLQGFYRGVLFFQAGLAKKLLIADNLAPLADRCFKLTAADAVVQLGTWEAWAGALAYTFQIYFDFSGYSDMAIGLGLMIGFRLPINFEQPYRSVSITDFWRRWHISLSAFLRDYLYIPLGGNRKGTLRTYLNLTATMLLGGLWHGAAWTFVVWGAYQGFWLVVERVVGKRPLYARLWWPFRVGMTFGLVVVGWVFFRAESLGGALDYLGVMFSLEAGAATIPVGVKEVAIGLAAAGTVWFTPTTQSLLLGRSESATPWSYVLALQVLFFLAQLHLLHQSHIPFLYFQF